ncbi:MAG: sugar phosphate nucleotidyltransferase, partial [Lachnospiraceae bacterium]|nr:sugar phosphate nucleotidyltransferase [Lachnospiraceae bacterium]
MAIKALGIVTSGNRIKVEGMQEFRPVSAFTFVGRYRMIDFPMSNLSNSNIERIQIFAGNNPRSLAEHVGTGRHYGINSKRGKVTLLFSDDEEVNEIYNTDIAAFLYNENVIERAPGEYVIIVPSYMVFAQDYDALLKQHIASGADITLLYHKVDNADKAFLNTEALKLDDEKTVLAIETNIGGKPNKNIFMNSYIMKKDLFLQLVNAAKKKSSMYNLFNIVNDKAATE